MEPELAEKTRWSRKDRHMLQGSLDNFTIPEILGLLASTTKTGRLKISGDRGTGSIWCEDGKLQYAEASKLAGINTIDDVMLELLRYQSGNFSFHADDLLPDDAEPTSEEVDTVLAGAATRLDEWYAIEAVVPSLGHSLTPVAALATDDVTLEADEWEFLVAIGDSRTVGDVASRLGLGEIDVSRRAKGLIERSLVDITEHPNRRTADFAGAVVDEPASADEPAEEVAIDEPTSANESLPIEEILPAVEPIAFDEPVVTADSPVLASPVFDSPVLESAALDSAFVADSGVTPVAGLADDSVSESSTEMFADALAESVGEPIESNEEVGLTSSIFEPAPSSDTSRASASASTTAAESSEPADLASLRESILSEDGSGTDTSVLMQFLNDDR